MNKITIFVHTCGVYEHSRASKIFETWGNRDDVIFITDTTKSTLKNNICIGEYPAGYTYHPENVIKMFNLFISNFTDSEWYMIVDDDTYVYVDRLLEFLDFYDANDCLMLGDFLNWTSNNNLDLTYDKWIGGGAGIIFTRSCVRKFLDLTVKYPGKYNNHDVWLHNLYNMGGKKDIKRIHCPGFHQQKMNNVAEDQLQHILPKQLISIHLRHDIDLLYKFNKFK
jgi:hypothetical protein